MEVALKIMKSFEKHRLNQFSLQESHDGQMNLMLNEGLLITSIGDEDTYLEVLERIISECSTVREIMEETSNKLQDEMLLGYEELQKRFYIQKFADCYYFVGKGISRSLGKKKQNPL